MTRLAKAPKASMRATGVEGGPNKSLGIKVRPPVPVTSEQIAAVRATRDQEAATE